MFKKFLVLMLALALVLSLFSFTSSANEGPSGKSVYFQDGKAVNADIPYKGNNTKAVIAGDALKIGFTATEDPGIDIKMHDNVDTNTYKILALKVKKTHNEEIEGEIFYNEKGLGAIGGKRVDVPYAATTDWQWVYIDLGAVNAGNVGYMRFDVYKTAPSTDDLVYVAAFGFFKSTADAQAFADTTTGKDLGSKLTDRSFPFEVWFTKTGDITIGTWLNQHPEGEVGYFWTKFNANAGFTAINYFIYAGDTPAEAVWKLFKYKSNLEATLNSEPVASGDISTLGNTWLISEFDRQGPGQYLFYIEYIGGSHFVVANHDTPVGEDLIEYGTNGNPSTETHRYMTGSIIFEENESGVYYNAIEEDKAEENPTTGDVALIGYAAVAFVTALLKKKRY